MDGLNGPDGSYGRKVKAIPRRARRPLLRASVLEDQLYDNKRNNQKRPREIAGNSRVGILSLVEVSGSTLVRRMR